MPFILLARVERWRPGTQRFDTALQILIGDPEIDQPISPIGRLERVGRFEISENQTDVVQMRKHFTGCEPDAISSEDRFRAQACALRSKPDQEGCPQCTRLRCSGCGPARNYRRSSGETGRPRSA